MGHVHLILVPQHEDGLRAALSRVHRAYVGHVHAREKRTGHFWQGRYGCVAMDEALSMALRHAETVGRPLGDGKFLIRIERTLGRDPRRRKRGPEPEKSTLSP